MISEVPKIQTTHFLLHYLVLSLCMHLFLIGGVEADIVEDSKCMKKTFSKPYVVVRKTKDGPDVARLEDAGILDLRDVVRHFVCMNGAVILYKGFDFFEIPKPKPKPPKTPKPADGGKKHKGDGKKDSKTKTSISEGGAGGGNKTKGHGGKVGENVTSIVEGSGNSTNSSVVEDGEASTNMSIPEGGGNITDVTHVGNGTKIESGGNATKTENESNNGTLPITSEGDDAGRNNTKKRHTKPANSKHTTNVTRKARKHKGIKHKREAEIVAAGFGNDHPKLNHIASVEEGKTVRFTNATFKIFSHTCLPVNWVSGNPEIKKDNDSSSVTASLVGAYQMAGVFLIVPTEQPDKKAEVDIDNSTKTTNKNHTEANSTSSASGNGTISDHSHGHNSTSLSNDTSIEPIEPSKNATESNSTSLSPGNGTVTSSPANATDSENVTMADADPNTASDNSTSSNATDSEDIAKKLKRDTGDNSTTSENNSTSSDPVREDEQVENGTNSETANSTSSDILQNNATDANANATGSNNTSTDSVPQNETDTDSTSSGDTISDANSTDVDEDLKSLDTSDDDLENSEAEAKKKKEPDRIQLFFNHKELGYKLGKEEDIIMDACFVISGPGSFCMRLLPIENHTIYLTTMARDEFDICRWVPSQWERKSENYKRFFRRALHITDYEWIECPQRKSKGCVGSHCGGGQITEEVRHKPFAKYKDSDEVEKFHHHHKKKKGSHNVPEEEESSDEIFEETDDISGKKDYLIQLGDCVRLPSFNGNQPCCKFMNAKISQGSAAVKQCPKLSAALELEYDEEDEENEEAKAKDGTESKAEGKDDKGKGGSNSAETGGKDDTNSTKAERKGDKNSTKPEGKDDANTNSTKVEDKGEANFTQAEGKDETNSTKPDSRRRRDSNNDTVSDSTSDSDTSKNDTDSSTSHSGTSKNDTDSSTSHSGTSKNDTDSSGDTSKKESHDKKDSSKKEKGSKKGKDSDTPLPPHEDKESEPGTGGNKEGEEEEEDSSFLPGTMDDIPELRWKHELMLLLAEIFIKICVPIKAESVYQLMTTISNILMNEHTPEPREGKYAHLVQKTNMWDIITAGLHRCSEAEATKQLDWELEGENPNTPSQPPPESPATEGGLMSARKKRNEEIEAPVSTALENSFDLISKVGNLNEAGALDDEFLKEMEDEEEDKLIIQRSPSVFDFNDDDDATNEFIFGLLPRWEFETSFGMVPRLRRNPEEEKKEEENEKKEEETKDEGKNEEEKKEKEAKGEGKTEDEKKDEKKEVETKEDEKKDEIKEGEKKDEEKSEDGKKDGENANDEKADKEKVDETKKSEEKPSEEKKEGESKDDKGDEEKEEKDKEEAEDESDEDDLESIKLPNVPLPGIQEYIPPMRIARVEHDPEEEPETETEEGVHIMRHEDFMIFPEKKEDVRIKGNDKKQIFFYEDVAEVVYNLNPVIDAFWKIMVTALAYCQKYQKGRQSSVYPLAYSQFEQYFLSPLKDEWIHPKIPQEMRMVVGEFGDEDRKMWLSTCLETAYIEGHMLHFRSPRPLYLEDIGSEDKGHVETKRMRTNEFTEKPEDQGDKGKYFMKEPKMPKAKFKMGEVAHNKTNGFESGNKTTTTVKRFS